MENPIPGQDQMQAPAEDTLFGGDFPVDQVEESTGDTISLEDTSEGEDTVSIEPQGQYRPAVSGSVMDTRAAKIMFALGNEGATREQVLAALQGGSEDALRRSIADAEALKARTTKEQIIREKAAQGAPLSVEDVAFMGGIAKYEHKPNPETIIEERYANRVVQSVQNLNGGTRNPIGESYRNNPQRTVELLDIGQEMIARQEIVKSAIEDAQAAYDKQSWIGWGVDQLKGLVPLYNSYKLGYGKVGNESVLEGSVIADMVRQYWSLPLDKMATEFRKDISEIAKDNPGLARKISEAMLTYTRESQFTDNMFDALNIVTAPGVGTAARLAGKGVTKATEAVAAAAGRGVAKEAASAVPARSVPEGYIRLYRGEKDFDPLMNTPGVARGGYWSEQPSVATKYGENQFYIDIPKDGNEFARRNGKAGSGSASDSIGEWIIDPAWANKNRKAVGSDPAAETVKAAVRANADLEPNLVRMVDELGDARKASELQVQGKAAQILKQSDTTGTVSDLVNQLPDFLRPDSIARGTSTLSGPRAIALAERLEANSANIAKVISEGVKVGRAPEEVYLQVLKEESEALKAEVLRNANVEHAIINVQHTLPSTTTENVASVKVLIGTTDKATFDTQVEAINAASQRYKIPVGNYMIEQHGGGYVIAVKKNIDETSDAFRVKINTEANSVQPSLANTFLGFLRSADDRVPQFQIGNRLVTVHGRSALEKTFKDMRDQIGFMPQKATDEVSEVMKLDRIETPKNWEPRFEGDTPPRGVFRETFGEFEQTFYDIHKKFPTEQQINAYFTARRLHDWDYLVRNLGVYRDRARLGLETVTLRDSTYDAQSKTTQYFKDEFVGKRIKSLPYNSTHNAEIIIHDGGKDPIRHYLLGATPEQKANIDRLLKEGYQIVQVENPVRVPFTDKFGQDPVHYVITKNVEVRALDPIQLPYRPGWHSEYDYGWYVKQPQIRKAGGQEIEGGVAPVRHIYEGDKTWAGFTTRAEAEKYATNMEKARKMLLAGDKSLDSFVESNLPYTSREFRRLFIHGAEGDKTPPPFDINAPFLHVENGKSVTDDFGKHLASQYENFEDAVRNPHNLFATSVDKKFFGQRDDVIQTVREGNRDGRPFMEMTTGAEVDPFVSLQSTMRNIIRNRHFADYKISHVEGWAQQFGHLLDGMTLEEVKANPVWTIHNGKFVETPGNKQIIAAAESSRRALLELIGTKGPLETSIDALRMNVLDSIYKRDGQEWAQYAKRNFVQNNDKDPVSLMRKMAFHLNIGLFNPYQLVQNAMTMTHALAIAGPVHGFSGAASSLPMRMVLADERLLDKFARLSTSWGYKPEWFKEAFQELKRTGKYIVEGEHTWKDDLAEVSLTKTKMGSFLDAGLAFFKEGERMSRIAAWNMAYREWRVANPTKQITDEIRAQLIARSDLMTANMTRASNASWQQGIMTIPTQFASYHTRLAEQMLGKRLTPAEKARLVGFNSILYGVPIGVGGATGLGALTGGQIPWHENIREAMLSRGYDPENWAVDAFNGGVTNIVARLITGEPTDLAGKVGPGGGSLLKNIFFEDKSMIEIAFGASGTKAKQIMESLDPVMKWVMSPFRDDESQYPLKPEDALGVIRQVKSVDSALAVVYAANYGLAYAKNGQQLGSMTTLQAVFQAATGGGPRALSDMNLMQSMNKDRKELVRKVTEVAARDGDGLAEAAIRGDEDSVKAYQTRIAAHLSFAKLLPAERAQVYQQIISKHKDKLNQVRMEFYLKNVPSDQVVARQDAFFKTGTAQ